MPETPPPADPKQQQRYGDYLIGNTFARGSFGKIKHATHVPTNTKLAVKVLSRHKITSSNMDVKIRREIRILMLFRHNAICRLYDVIYTPSEILLVMEFVGPELYEFIVKNGKLKEDAARYMFQQLICALEYCHHFRVVHRDLKPENLLLGSGLSVKLIDFGLSNLMQDSTFLKTSCGSPNYAAPEVISGRLYAGPEIDVWSVGVVLYALLCGCLPFDEETIPLLFARIKKGKYVIPPHVTPQARDLIEKLLVVDPLSRITIPQIRDHPWFLEKLPPHLEYNEMTFNQDQRGFPSDVIKETASILGMTHDEVHRQLEQREGRAWVTCNILADQKEASQIQTSTAKLVQSPTDESSPTGANKASALETNLGLVLSASPAMVAMLDAPDPAVNKTAYNTGNFVPASMQDVKSSSVSRLGTSPGLFCLNNAGVVSGSPHSVPISGSLRSGSLATTTGLSSSDASGPKVRSGSVVKMDKVYSVEEENYILQNNIGWRIGVMSSYRSAVIMSEVYAILMSMQMEWKVLKPFTLACRKKGTDEERRKDPAGDMVFTLHVFRIQEKHDKGYVIDMGMSRGVSSSAMDVISAVADRLRHRLG